MPAAGSRYKVQFLVPPARVPREMVAVYLGWNPTFKKHQFSLRPHGGTMSLDPEHIVGEMAPTTDAVHMPRKVASPKAAA